MLRTKGFCAIAVIVAGVAARTNAMDSHRTTESMVGVRPRSRDPKQPVPNGLIHDWIGAVFTQNATRRVPGDRRHRSEPGYPEFSAVVGKSGGQPSGGGLDVKHS